MKQDPIPTMQLRKAGERGFFDHGWLKTYHTFLFGDYEDRKWTHFRSLRVINEDWVAAGQGFPPHSHRDMEIITYVLKGALEHKDSMGNASAIKPGEVQRMSAGTGVTHSEFNHMPSEPVHLLQIWIFPEKKSTAPGYEQKAFTPEGKRNALRLVASPDGGDAVKIHQDVRLYDARLEPGHTLKHAVKAGRGVWIQIVSGALDANGTAGKAGDGIFTEDAGDLKLSTKETADFLLFDLA